MEQRFLRVRNLDVAAQQPNGVTLKQPMDNRAPLTGRDGRVQVLAGSPMRRRPTLQRANYDSLPASFELNWFSLVFRPAGAPN
jgi:hypothetical protein